jgi:peptidyl-prolyl cis-trans isomerase B (cyclophilin B)
MPKRLLLPAFLLVAAAALTACGDDSSDTATDSSGTTASASPSSSASAGGSSSAAPSDVTCDYPTSQVPTTKLNDPPPSTPTLGGDVTVTVDSSLGALTWTMDATKAPCTVNSFVSLATQNYFNGTHCHRLTTQGIYVLQCGDPTATGTGGPGYTIPDEVDGSETYPAGTLAMAKTQEPNSGGSQFFIVYQDTDLPPDYTVFGTVDQATIDAVTDLAAKGTDETNGPGDGHPLEDVDINTVTVG